MLKLIIIAAGAMFGIALGSGLAVLREIIARMMSGQGSAVAVEPVPAAATVVSGTAKAAATGPPSSRELPVIAHIPAAAASQRRFSLSGRKFVESSDVERKTQIGVSRTVDMLLRHSVEDRPSTIVFISPDNDNTGGYILPDVAGALNRLDKEVLFSGGEGGRDPSANEAPLSDKLKFNRLPRGVQRRLRGAAPTFSNFAGQRRKADFIIIDANGEEARHHLAELLERASGILLIAREGDEGHLGELVDSLSPWRDRMLGTIKLGTAA